MAEIVQVFIENNAFVMVTSTDRQERSRTQSEIRKNEDGTYNIFLNNVIQDPRNIAWDDFRDDTNTAFSSQSNFDGWRTTNLFSSASGSSGAGFARTFSGATKTDAETARDAFYTANPSQLRDGLQVAVIATTPDPDEVTIQIYSEGLSAWEDITDVLSGSEIAILLGTVGWEQFDSAEETKLSGIETGATADQTGAEMVVAINAEDDANIMTDENLVALQNSLQEASASGQTITFTREDGTTFDVSIVTGAPGVVPPPVGPSGETLLSLSDTLWDASTGSFPASSDAGEMFRVSVGGTVDGQTFTTNDLIISLTDNASTSTYSSNWHKVEGGVHSWGGLYGIITDQNIIDKLTRLNFERNTTYAAPSVHNFQIAGLPSRVDLNTDLNVQRTLSFDITNRLNIQTFEVIVVVGDNITLTNPTIDGTQTQDVTFTGIDTSSQTVIQISLRITDTQGTTHNSNTISVDVRNLETHQQVHFGFVGSSEDQTNIDFTNDDISTAENVAGSYTVSGIPTDSSLHRIYWAYPTDQTIARVQQSGFTLYDPGLSSGNQFTLIEDVTIDSQTYDVLLMNAAAAVNSNYNGQTLTVS